MFCKCPLVIFQFLIGIFSPIYVPSVFGQMQSDSPSRLTPLPKIHQFEPFDSYNSMASVADANSELIELKNIQNEHFSKIKTLKGKAWSNTIKPNDENDTVSLIEFTIETRIPNTKEIHWFPPMFSKQQRFTSNKGDLDLVYVFLSTPSNRVLGTGFARQGIDELEIELSDPKSSPTQFSFQQVFFGNRVSPFDLHSQFKSLQENQVIKMKVAKSDSLFEVKWWPAKGTEKNCRRWVFDLSKGGVAVYYEDLVSSAGSVTQRTNYQQINNCWIPAVVREERFNDKTREWENLRQFTYFDLELNSEIPQSEYSIASLPVGDDVIVVDKRTGRGQRMQFRDIKFGE